MERTAVNPVTWSLGLGFNQGELVSGPARTLYCAGQTAMDADGKPAARGRPRRAAGAESRQSGGRSRRSRHVPGEPGPAQRLHHRRRPPASALRRTGSPAGRRRSGTAPPPCSASPAWRSRPAGRARSNRRRVTLNISCPCRRGQLRVTLPESAERIRPCLRCRTDGRSGTGAPGRPLVQRKHPAPDCPLGGGHGRPPTHATAGRHEQRRGDSRLDASGRPPNRTSGWARHSPPLSLGG